MITIIMIARFQQRKDHKTLLQALALSSISGEAQLVSMGSLLEPMRTMAPRQV